MWDVGIEGGVHIRCIPFCATSEVVICSLALLLLGDIPLYVCTYAFTTKIYQCVVSLAIKRLICEGLDMPMDVILQTRNCIIVGG